MLGGAVVPPSQSRTDITTFRYLLRTDPKVLSSITIAERKTVKLRI
jgi:hypothetical protein